MKEDGGGLWWYANHAEPAHRDHVQHPCSDILGRTQHCHRLHRPQHFSDIWRHCSVRDRIVAAELGVTALDEEEELYQRQISWQNILKTSAPFLWQPVHKSLCVKLFRKTAWFQLEIDVSTESQWSKSV